MLGQHDKCPEDTVFKRQFRWAAKFKKNEEVLYEGFVKVPARPNVEEEEINYLCKKMWIPGKASWEQISISQYGVKDLEKWLKDIEDLNEVELVLYDGCGIPLEKWVLHEARVPGFRVTAYLDDPYPYNTEVDIRYTKVDFIPQGEKPHFDPK